MCQAVVNSDVECISYLILKLLCSVSISWNRGEVVGPFIVILVHCMKRMTAVRRDRQRKKGGKTGKYREGGRETDRGGGLGVSTRSFSSFSFKRVLNLEVTGFPYALSLLESEE